MKRPEIENNFVDALVKSGLVHINDFKFAPTKLFERSKTKLLQYLEKKQNKDGDYNNKDIKNALDELKETALYELKDLLRGSITTDS